MLPIKFKAAIVRVLTCHYYYVFRCVETRVRLAHKVERSSVLFSSFLLLLIKIQLIGLNITKGYDLLKA